MPGDFPAGHRWPTTLRSAELVLRPFSKRDEITWEAVRSANYAWTQPWDATLPPEATTQPLTFAAWLRRTSQQAKQGSSLPFALAIDPGWPADPRPDEFARLIGQVTVSGIVYGSARSASIGYWIDRHYAGRNLVPRGVAMAADYCWQVLLLHRIEIAIRPENAPSLRVVEKLGFREEGLRPRFLHIDGDWRDHRVFALNRDEVPAGGLLGRLGST